MRGWRAQDSQRAFTTKAHTSLSTWFYKLNEEDPDFQDMEPGSVLWGSVSVLSWGLKVGSWLSYILRPHINPHVDSLFLFFLRTTTYFVRKTKPNVQGGQSGLTGAELAGHRQSMGSWTTLRALPKSQGKLETGHP